MKQIRFYVMLVALCMILPLTSYAAEHRSSHRGEIRVLNDTETQITFYITTEKYGRKPWTYKPGMNTFPNVTVDQNNVRLRVKGDDTIEIGDWGKANIEDVAEFKDGAWNLSIRHAHRELRDLHR